MDDTTKTEIKAQLKVKELEAETFSKKAQEDLNQRGQVIQQANQDLQTQVRIYQSEIDKRLGAIEALKAMIGETKAEKKPRKTKKE